VEIAVRALESGGAVARIVEAKPIKSGSYLGLVGSDGVRDVLTDHGVRVAWLHVGHLDVINELAPDSAFPSGVYPGISRVAFPGYSEAASSSQAKAKAKATPLPCQECFNALPYCECE
jgi:hypothetical protein